MREPRRLDELEERLDRLAGPGDGEAARMLIVKARSGVARFVHGAESGEQKRWDMSRLK
mgnify:CR=1 FL=1